MAQTLDGSDGMGVSGGERGGESGGSGDAGTEAGESGDDSTTTQEGSPRAQDAGADGIAPETANSWPHPHATFAQALEAARDSFVYGDYADVGDTLEPWMFPAPPQAAPADLVESWTLLGVSLLFLDRRDDAANAFWQLLRAEPTWQPDPLLYPSEVLSFVRFVRETHGEELENLIGESGAGTTVYVEARVLETPLLLSMAPFGYGFLASNRPGWGITYLAAQVLLGATSMGLYFANQSELRRWGYNPNPRLAEARNAGITATGAAFFAAVVANAIHGALTHEAGNAVEYRTLDAPPAPLEPGSDLGRPLARLAALLDGVPAPPFLLHMQ